VTITFSKILYHGVRSLQNKSIIGVNVHVLQMEVYCWQVKQHYIHHNAQTHELLFICMYSFKYAPYRNKSRCNDLNEVMSQTNFCSEISDNTSSPVSCNVAGYCGKGKDKVVPVLN